MNRAVVVLLLLIANAIVSTRQTTTDTPSRSFRELRAPSRAGGEKPPRKVIAPFFASRAPSGAATQMAGEQLESRRASGGFDLSTLTDPSSAKLTAAPGCAIDRHL